MSEYIVEIPKEPAKVVRDGWNVRIEWQYKQREEIVRCRDCKDYRESDATCHSWQWHNWDAAIEVEPGGFCAWACRKEGGDD